MARCFFDAEIMQKRGGVGNPSEIGMGEICYSSRARPSSHKQAGQSVCDPDL